MEYTTIRFVNNWGHWQTMQIVLVPRKTKCMDKYLPITERNPYAMALLPKNLLE